MISRRKSAAPSVVTVAIGGDYSGDLQQRLTEYGVTAKELSVASGITKEQFSRWFREREDGSRMQPSMQNIMRIEHALAECRARKQHERKVKKGK